MLDIWHRVVTVHGTGEEGFPRHMDDRVSSPAGGNLCVCRKVVLAV